MDVATDILRLADKVGVVPGLAVACKLAMQILQTVQVCEQMRSSDSRPTWFGWFRCLRGTLPGCSTWATSSQNHLLPSRKTWKANGIMRQLLWRSSWMNTKRRYFITLVWSTCRIWITGSCTICWRLWNDGRLRQLSYRSLTQEVVTLISQCWRKDWQIHRGRSWEVNNRHHT